MSLAPIFYARCEWRSLSNLVYKYGLSIVMKCKVGILVGILKKNYYRQGLACSDLPMYILHLQARVVTISIPKLYICESLCSELCLL